MEEFRATRAAEVKARTVYHETVLVKQLLNYACSRGFARKNVLKALKVSKPVSTRRSSYTLEQVEDILKATKEPYRSMFELLAFTGLRLGELRFLSWDDVDAEGAWLHVRAKPDVGWRPKSGKDRKAPLHSRARAVLDRIPHAGRWLFARTHTENGVVQMRQIAKNKVLKRLKSVLRKVHIEDGTVHGFRHFFITHCADSGVPPLQLMEWVGHADLRVILDYYHSSDEASRRVMASVSFGGDANPCDANSKQAQIEDTSNGKRKR